MRTLAFTGKKGENNHFEYKDGNFVMKLMVMPVDVLNGEFTAIGNLSDFDSYIKRNPEAIHSILNILRKWGFIASNEVAASHNPRKTFVADYMGMSRQERRKAKREYEKKHNGRFFSITELK